MAIWNYRYYLIPSAAIRNKFNSNKDIILDEYRSNGFQNFNENKSFENYFIDNDVILLSIINEAKKHGFKRVIVPVGNMKNADFPEGIEIIPVKDIRECLDIAFSNVF